MSTLFSNPSVKSINCISTNGYNIYLGCGDGNLYVINSSGDILQKLIGHAQYVTSIKQLPQFIISSSFDGTVIAWNNRTFEKYNTMKDHVGSVNGIEVKDECIFSIGQDGKVIMWSVQSSGGIILCSFNESLYSIFIKGSILIVGTRNGKVHLLTLSKAAASVTAYSILASRSITSMHEGPILTLQFYSDRLISGGYDGFTRSWAASNGFNMLTFDGDKSPIYSSYVYLENTVLITASANGNIYKNNLINGKEFLLHKLGNRDTNKMPSILAICHYIKGDLLVACSDGSLLAVNLGEDENEKLEKKNSKAVEEEMKYKDKKNEATQFKCSFHGCGTFLISEKDKLMHENDCKLKNINCRFDGCNEMVSPLDIENHTLNCGYRPMRCMHVGCTITLPFIHLRSHSLDCSFCPLPCPSCQQFVSKYRLSDHLKDCEICNLKCKFLKDGCSVKGHGMFIRKHEDNCVFKKLNNNRANENGKEKLPSIQINNKIIENVRQIEVQNEVHSVESDQGEGDGDIKSCDINEKVLDKEKEVEADTKEDQEERKEEVIIFKKEKEKKASLLIAKKLESILDLQPIIKRKALKNSGRMSGNRHLKYNTSSLLS